MGSSSHSSQRLSPARPPPVFPPPSSSKPADIVTYRLNTQLVYVTPAQDYKQALDFAYDVFPDELASVDRNRLSFSISVITHNEKHAVRIGPMAWAAVVATLLRYEIIDIFIQPQLSVSDHGHDESHDEILDDDKPPQYPYPLLNIDTDTDTLKEETDQSRQSSRSVSPQSRSHSRQTSPSGRSVHSTGSARGGAKGWFDKHF